MLAVAASQVNGTLLEARDWPVLADLVAAQASVAEYVDYSNHKCRHPDVGYLIFCLLASTLLLLPIYILLS